MVKNHIFYTMSRINKIFEKKNKQVLNVYFTAGYPALNDTVLIMKLLVQAGVDLIEIGMPYSDPLADGTVIQESSSIALENGMNIKLLFNQLKEFRKDPLMSNVGVVLMGYMNPVLQFGFDQFCANASAVGVDALILPDLPEYEFEHEYGSIVQKYGLDFIFLVTPETSEKRIIQLDQLSTGFLYAVSSSATTGGDKDFSVVETYLLKLKQLNLKNPIMVGFGIKDKSSFNIACKYANGAIIGSAFIKSLAKSNSLDQIVDDFIGGIIK